MCLTEDKHRVTALDEKCILFDIQVNLFNNKRIQLVIRSYSLGLSLTNVLVSLI
jgi:hypothetical protein